jgi:acyl-CoA synthetase (AMP-forming)/AMP-acid ligase II
MARPILLALPNGPELLYAIWACLAAGIPFCIVSPERVGHFLSSMTERDFPPTLEPAFVVGDADIEVHARRLGYAACSGVDLERLAAGMSPVPAVPVEPSRIVYFQLTSGSSGPPKAVPVSWGMLTANISQMSKRCKLQGGDKLVLWAPMSHDMGLVSWLSLQAAGARMLLMETRSFVRNPLSWLSHLMDFRGSVSAAPTFALHAAATLARRRGTTFDLSALRVLWVGGEPVFPRIVDEFIEVFGPSALRPEAIHPTYGMAEAVVGVSTKSPAELPKHVSVCAVTLNEAGIVRVTEDDAPGTVAIMSCGSPVDGICLEVRPIEGREPLGEDRVGRIMIRGANVATRYTDMEEDTPDGWRDTGDMGFVHGAEVYIVGRSKNVLGRAGVKVHAEQAEDAVRRALGDAVRRVAAFSSIDHAASVERIFVVCETTMSSEELRGQVSAALVQRCGIAVDDVLAVKRGSIPVTSSGKIRRDQLRMKFGLG